jgi:hypothetical protein
LIEPAFEGADPQPAGLIEEQRHHPIVAEALRVPRIVAVGSHGPSARSMRLSPVQVPTQSVPSGELAKALTRLLVSDEDEAASERTNANEAVAVFHRLRPPPWVPTHKTPPRSW